MSRLSLLNSPLVVGFDHLEQMLERISKASSDGYPPYNIEQRGLNGLRITLAVAGFGRDDLAIEVENHQLTIRGKQGEDDGRAYLYRGIAARQFQRTFVLAEGIEVTGASMDRGLLHIDLRRPDVTARVRKIAIGDGAEEPDAEAIEVGSDTATPKAS